MSSARTRITRRLAIATLVGVAVASAVALPAQAKTTSAATSHSTWSRVSLGSLNNFTAPSLLRLSGNRLLAGWTEVRGPDDTSSVQTAVFSGSKMTLSARGTIVSGWSDLSSSPQFATIDGQILAGYVGIHSTATLDPLNGPVIGSRSSDGVTWAQDAQPLSGADAGGTYGLGLVSDDATPVTGFIPTSTDTIGYHTGYSTTGADDNVRVLSGPGGDVLYLSMARDSATGAVYSAWFTLGGPSEGIHVQQISPTLGPILTAPGVVTSAGTAIPEKNIAITTTSTGGIWVAYGRGYPEQKSIVAWNPETGKTVTVASHQSSVGTVDLSAGPSGKLWASWLDNGIVKASRSDSGVTRFGGIASIKPPGHGGAYSVTAEGSAGPLDVFVNATLPSGIGNALYHTVVKPTLSVKTSKSSFSSKKGGKETVTVTDAGAAVSHAKVKFNGKTFHTNAKGKLVLKVKKGLKRGTKSISVTKSGFSSTVAKVKVKK